MLQRYIQYYTQVNLLRCYILLRCFGFTLGFLFSKLLRCYIVTVLYLLFRCYDAMALITPNYRYRGARDMYKLNVLTLLRRILRFELHPNQC